LRAAIRGTFGKRETAVIEFDDLITELLDSETLQRQSTAFLGKSTISGPETYPEVLALIGKFLSPVFSSISNNKALNQKWAPPGAWRSNQRQPVVSADADNQIIPEIGTSILPRISARIADNPGIKQLIITGHVRVSVNP